MTYFRYSMLTPIVMAASCTTAAYDRERSHCAVHWHNLIPAKFEDRLFTEYRQEKEFKGTTVCRQINGQTICEHGYNTVMVPYTVVDQVDIHKKAKKKGRYCGPFLCLKKSKRQSLNCTKCFCSIYISRLFHEVV